MASKRRLRRKSCGDKRRFNSQAHADSTAIRIEEKTGVWMVGYRCKFCGSYHIGRTPKGVRQSIRQSNKQKRRKGVDDTKTYEERVNEHL